MVCDTELPKRNSAAGNECALEQEDIQPESQNPRVVAEERKIREKLAQSLRNITHQGECEKFCTKSGTFNWPDLSKHSIAGRKCSIYESLGKDNPVQADEYVLFV